MFTKQRLMFLYSEMPVHPGSGTSTGVIDMPIQREVWTELPIIQPSGLKGALREYFEKKHAGNIAEKNKIKQVFGTESSDYSGAMGLSQARILLFPLASLKGLFVYATSPMCLHMLKKDIQGSTTQPAQPFPSIPSVTDERTALVPTDNNITVNSRVILSQFGFTATTNNDVANIAKWISDNAMPDDGNNTFDYWKTHLSTSMIILHDDIFKEFTKIKSEVVYRNRIGNNGVVVKGGLWTEEYIPADTLMWTNIFAMRPLNGYSGALSTDDEVLNYMQDQGLTHFFVGGNQTIGRGLLRVRF
jgi:CRISPR-associated protein Cmr4